MSTPVPARAFDPRSLSFAPSTKKLNNGGTMVDVQYSGKPLEFQLGQVKDQLRIPFGVDSGTVYDTPDRKVVKVEVNGESCALVKGLEAALLDAAVAHAKAWFGAELSRSQIEGRLCSSIKEQQGDRPPLLKVTLRTDLGRRASHIEFSTLKGDKMTPPKPGVADDIRANASCVCVVRDAAGVWFRDDGDRSQFGISLVASRIVCFSTQQSEAAKPAIDFDVEMTDASDPDSPRA